MRLSLLALLLASLAFGADNKPLLNDNPRPSLTNPLALSATDLTLMQKGQSPYQIVLPDETPSPRIKEALQQTARLLQTAFAANGCEIKIVEESKKDATKPALFLGNTQFARQHDFVAASLRDWSYVHRAVGENIIIAGNDAPAAVAASKGRPAWDRMGTAKATVDFVREFMGVRFLYPDIDPFNGVQAAAKIDLRTCPGIEYLPRKTFVIPAGLNRTKIPVIRSNTGFPECGGFYDLANNRFPPVDETFGVHTWERAVPVEKFAASHPEYFALINKARLTNEPGRAQYCLSNPDVQELIYQDAVAEIKRGYATIGLGQPDGFRACQCAECEKFLGTGKDWSEKIWIFHRNVAERLQHAHPDRKVTIMSYIQTAPPPKAFKAFPANTTIMLTGTNEEDIAAWRGIEVPHGFTGYIYNWCPNLGTRYTPMRTPGYVEAQVRRLAVNRIQSIYRDGPGQLFGLEGPVFYTMGRMFDDPEHNAAKTLVPEFVEAAFGPNATGAAMRSFYDQLYQGISLYSDHIGTRNDLWRSLSYDGRAFKTVTDPFQFIAFIYNPNLLAALESDLSQAEKTALSVKTKLRLALVRREFDYIRHLARVVHLYQAFQIQPDVGARDRLLDAIDARNAFIASLYDAKGRNLTIPGWERTLFPLGGHNQNHLRLSQDGYQEPYANTCFNWDTKAMRQAPMAGPKQLKVTRVAEPMKLDDPRWQNIASTELTHCLPLAGLPRSTRLQLSYDGTALYVHTESALEANPPVELTKLPRDGAITKQESIEVYLQPLKSKDLFYHLAVGANADSKYDAASGFITDLMDPRHGKGDPTWNGDWQAVSRVDEKTKLLHTLFIIPFKILGAEPPTAGTQWGANFGRNHPGMRNRIDRSTWSSSFNSNAVTDAGVIGQISFE